MIDDPRAFKKGPARGGEASMAPAGQPVEQTLSRVILMGINSATKEPQPLNIDPDTGGIQVSNGVTSVAATAPLTSSGGTAPIVALTAGTDKQILISNGTAYSSQTVSGDVTIGNTGVVAIGANKVTDAMIRQGVARTVIGRSANSTGNVADISLAADGKFLGSRASAIGAFYPTQRLSKSTTYSLAQDDYGALVDCDTTSAGFTVTLPAPGTVGAGWWCTIRKTNSSTANVVTIARNASETINGASASNTLTAQYSYITLLCDGTNWAVVGVNDFLNSYASSAAIGVATATWTDKTSISVPPGEWELSGVLTYILNGGTVTQVLIGVSAGSSGSSFSDAQQGDNQLALQAPTSNNDVGLSIPAWRTLLTSTTTCYLKARANFSVAGLNVAGRLSARRVG